MLARRLPVGLRLAVRDIGRHRTRNGPVVTAILGMLALSVMSSASTAAYDAESRREYVPALRDDQMVVEGPMAASVAAQLAEHDETIAAGEVVIAAVDGFELYAQVDPVVRVPPRSASAARDRYGSRDAAPVSSIGVSITCATRG